MDDMVILKYYMKTIFQGYHGKKEIEICIDLHFFVHILIILNIIRSCLGKDSMDRNLSNGL